MKKVLSISIFIAIVTVFSQCSSMSSPFKKLEGKWTASGDQGEGHSWYLEYTFKGNTYAMTGYPPISESGTMKLKETKGDSMLVEFKVARSDPEYQDHDSWVYFANDQITLQSITLHRSSE